MNERTRSRGEVEMNPNRKPGWEKLLLIVISALCYITAGTPAAFVVILGDSCTNTHIHIHTRTRTRTHTHTCTHTHTHAHTAGNNLCSFSHILRCVRACAFVRVCVSEDVLEQKKGTNKCSTHSHTHTHTRAHAHTHTHTHTHAHAHTHTHTQTRH